LRKELRLCFDRICPPRRGRPIAFALGDLADPKGLMAASASLIAAVAAGKLTPDEAEPVSAMLAAHLRAIEATDIAARLTEIEKKIGMRR
jgi:hypothetical protein